MYDRNTHLNIVDLGVVGDILRSVYSDSQELVIFDIGACEGISSVRYAKNFPNARVFSAEPLSHNLDHIEKNIAASGVKSITVIDAAFSDANGTADFHVSEGIPDKFKNDQLDWDFGNKSSSLLLPDKSTEHTPWLKFGRTETVQTRTLESYCNESKIEQIHFIHMDVQGAELKVLEGAGSLMDAIENVWLEVETVSLYKDQPVKKDIERFMKSKGFVKVFDTVFGISGDQFWMKKSLADNARKSSKMRTNQFKNSLIRWATLPLRMFYQIKYS